MFSIEFLFLFSAASIAALPFASDAILLLELLAVDEEMMLLRRDEACERGGHD